MTFLHDAKNHGAQFMQDTFVERVLVHKGKAVGVVGYQDGRKVTVNAGKVIVAAGSIHSPALLKRSGLQNKNIGRNLHLHPVCYAFGKFDEQIDCYQGSIMTAVSEKEFSMATKKRSGSTMSNDFHNLDDECVNIAHDCC